MALINPTLPTVGDPNSTEDPDIVSAFGAIVSAINGGLDTTNLASGAGVTDAQLASPNNAATKLLLRTSRVIGAGASYSGAGTSFAMGATGDAVDWDPTLYAVAGKTTRWVHRVRLVTGSTAPAVNLAVGMKVATASSLGVWGVPAYATAFTGSSGTSIAPAGSVNSLLMSNVVDSAPAAQVYVPVLDVSGGSGTTANGFSVIYELYVKHT